MLVRKLKRASIYEAFIGLHIFNVVSDGESEISNDGNFQSSVISYLPIIYRIGSSKGENFINTDFDIVSFVFVFVICSKFEI